MVVQREPHTLEDVLKRMASSGTDSRVCVEDLLDSFGQRSFGALLLGPSLIVVSPLSGIPGVSTVNSVLILLIALQMLIGRRTIWLPQHLLRRCIDRRRLDKAVTFLKPAAAAANILLRPRLTPLTREPFSRIIAAICVVLALVTPVFEVVPFAASITASAIAGFALALITHDGVLVVIAFVVTAISLYLGLTSFL